MDADLDRVKISPWVALALLESLRSTDTPVETLGDEDLQRSLPRRLGLSTAVADQIQRTEELARTNGSLPARAIVDLFSLVGRRPDADAVFAGAGRWLAARQLKRGPRPRLLGILPLPRFIRHWRALRATRKVARRVSPISTIRIERKPPALVLENNIATFATDSRDGCELLLAVFRAALHAVSNRPREVVHPMCESRGDDCCVWRMKA